MITPCDRIYTAGNAMHGQLAMGARQLDLYVEDLYNEISMRTTVNSRRRSRQRILGKRSSRKLMRRREKGGSSRLELGPDTTLYYWFKGRSESFVSIQK